MLKKSKTLHLCFNGYNNPIQISSSFILKTIEYEKVKHSVILPGVYRFIRG
mgnify:FL=1